MSHISKINNAFLDIAEDLDIAMFMYNMLEYSNNYSVTSGSFLNYNRDEVNNDLNGNNDAGYYSINENKTTTSRSFDYKTKITRRTRNNKNTSCRSIKIFE